ncbi:MAG: DUF4097 family beta strand repeat protein [Clostridia bacterium]|nr:DUF4097 family beta strand repeat protein [Clostridia bacterium]
MNRVVKIWLIIGASLVLIGAIIFGGVMTTLDWDFLSLSTEKYVTNEYEISDSYDNIKIITDTADIIFVPSENTKVVCYEETKIKHLVTVKDDTLVIEVNDTRKWYEHIGINFGSPKITVYIPKGEYGELVVKASTGDTEIPKEFKFESIDISQSTGNVKCLSSAGGDIKIKTSTGNVKCLSSAGGDIKIKTSTGNITTEKINADSLSLTVSTGEINVSDIECTGDLSIKVSTGKVSLKNVTCNNIISTGNTGGITLNNVIAKENFSVTRSTGNVKLIGCDAGEITITTDTGDVLGTLLSDKVFITKTDTGSVKVPETLSGGKCKITTDTGNIKIEIKK